MFILFLNRSTIIMITVSYLSQVSSSSLLLQTMGRHIFAWHVFLVSFPKDQGECRAGLSFLFPSCFRLRHSHWPIDHCLDTRTGRLSFKHVPWSYRIRIPGVRPKSVCSKELPGWFWLALDFENHWDVKYWGKEGLPWPRCLNGLF